MAVGNVDYLGWGSNFSLQLLHQLPAVEFEHSQQLVICHLGASNEGYEKVRNHLVGAFSWLKVATTAFTFKILLRHYAKRVLTPRSLNMKLGPRRNYHKGRAAIRHYANQTGSSHFQPGEGP